MQLIGQSRLEWILWLQLVSEHSIDLQLICLLFFEGDLLHSFTLMVSLKCALCGDVGGKLGAICSAWCTCFTVWAAAYNRRRPVRQTARIRGSQTTGSVEWSQL